MRYLSQCPNCQTVYQLSLMDLSISQGMVKCAHCKYNFDAFRQFIIDPDYNPPLTNYLTNAIAKNNNSIALPEHPNEKASQNLESIQYVNNLMLQNIRDSHLDLYAYLNYLEILSPTHIDQTSSASMQSKFPSYKDDPAHFRLQQKDVLNYLALGVIVVCLICLAVIRFNLIDSLINLAP